MLIKAVIIPAARCLSKRHLLALEKKSALGRGNAKGARRGDKNCAAFVITQIDVSARGHKEIFLFFYERDEIFALWTRHRRINACKESIFICKRIFFYKKKFLYYRLCITRVEARVVSSGVAASSVCGYVGVEDRNKARGLL